MENIDPSYFVDTHLSFEFKTNKEIDNVNFTMITSIYNVLRIMSGMGGYMYCHDNRNSRCVNGTEFE